MTFRSEPDVHPRSLQDFQENDWRNVSNTSYNLLDLDPFYKNGPKTPIKTIPTNRIRHSPSSPTMKTARSFTPSTNQRPWRSPSPDSKSPIGIYGKSSAPAPPINEYDKYKAFRNLTNHRDAQVRSVSPDKGKPYQNSLPKKRSPEKKVRHSQRSWSSERKSAPKSPEIKRKSIPHAKSPDKKRYEPYRSPEKKKYTSHESPEKLPALRSRG